MIVLPYQQAEIGYLDVSLASNLDGYLVTIPLPLAVPVECHRIDACGGVEVPSAEGGDGLFVIASATVSPA